MQSGGSARQAEQLPGQPENDHGPLYLRRVVNIEIAFPSIDDTVYTEGGKSPSLGRSASVLEVLYLLRRLAHFAPACFIFPSCILRRMLIGPCSDVLVGAKVKLWAGLQ